jgi:phage shock protein C
MSDIGRTNNPHKLYRDREHAMLAGVCAGLSNYFGFCRRAVRIIVFICLLLPPFMPFVIVSYVLLAFFLPVKPVEATVDQEKAQFWRGVSNAPSDVFSNVRHRFRQLDMRLQKMEAFVTSKEFEIDRELNRSSRNGESA